MYVENIINECGKVKCQKVLVRSRLKKCPKFVIKT